MASETNELTFVRCPSCRSLVPASAVRCRICNNPLEGIAQGGGAPEAPKAGGRVRQKTISADADEVFSITAEQPERAVAPQPVAVAPSNDGDHEGFSDPLSAYLQELEDDTAPAQSQGSAAPAESDEVEDEFDDLFGDMGDLDEEPIEEPAMQGAKAAASEIDLSDDDEFDAAPVASRVTPSHDGGNGAYGSKMSDEIAESPVAVQAPPAAAPKVEAPPPAPQKRETPPPQRVGQPFRLDKRNSPPPQAKPQQQRNDRPQEKRKEAHGNAGSSTRPERHERPREEPRKSNQEHSARPPERPHRREPENRPERAEVVHESRPAASGAGPRMGRMRPGRLFGWLVSFESADGRAIELREGKFFVTATSIRGTDLVIEDPSISTPHAMMSVSTEHGLLIQDLMSDRGVFVRSGERGQYRREDGVFEVRHGDWVRFGDVEFLVTVVPTGN